MRIRYMTRSNFHSWTQKKACKNPDAKPPASSNLSGAIISDVLLLPTTTVTKGGSGAQKIVSHYLWRHSNSIISDSYNQTISLAEFNGHIELLALDVELVISCKIVCALERHQHCFARVLSILNSGNGP